MKITFDSRDILQVLKEHLIEKWGLNPEDITKASVRNISREGFCEVFVDVVLNTTIPGQDL